MKSSKKNTLGIGAMVAASAFLAAVLTFGDSIVSSPISTASADAGDSRAMSACAGQTWPHFSEACLATMAQSSDRAAPARTLAVVDLAR